MILCMLTSLALAYYKPSRACYLNQVSHNYCSYRPPILYLVDETWDLLCNYLSCLRIARSLLSVAYLESLLACVERGFG